MSKRRTRKQKTTAVSRRGVIMPTIASPRAKPSLPQVSRQSAPLISLDPVDGVNKKPLATPVNESALYDASYVLKDLTKTGVFTLLLFGFLVGVYWIQL